MGRCRQKIVIRPVVHLVCVVKLQTHIISLVYKALRAVIYRRMISVTVVH